LVSSSVRLFFGAVSSLVRFLLWCGFFSGAVSSLVSGAGGR
jgi:hypothetical protein